MIKQKPIGSFVLYIYFLCEKIKRPQEKVLCVPNQIALLLTYPGPQMRTCNNALNAVRFLYQLIIFYCRLSTTSETRAKIHGENVALWTRASPLTLFNASPMHTVFFFFISVLASSASPGCGCSRARERKRSRFGGRMHIFVSVTKCIAIAKGSVERRRLVDFMDSWSCHDQHITRYFIYKMKTLNIYLFLNVYINRRKSARETFLIIISI